MLSLQQIQQSTLANMGNYVRNKEKPKNIHVKPIIGLTLDHQIDPSYSIYPWYALRENYCSSIAQFGGIPFPLSYDINLIESYLNLIQGLIITGGQFDIPPSFYGQEIEHEEVKINTIRSQFEKCLLEAALDKDIPILGICAGEQLLNVVLGGTMIQHIPTAVAEPLAHNQQSSRKEPSHAISITPGTLLHQWFGDTQTQVNSSHHQAIKDLGSGVVINAVAPDGVIEGIEVPHKRFCVGVQWHPEFLVSPVDQVIFSKFIEAASASK